MKRLGIYLSLIDPKVGPVFEKAPYKNAYPQLFSILIKGGTDVVLLHDQVSTYQGNGVFSEYWTFIMSGDEIEYEYHNQPTHVDFIYDKARFDADDVETLNMPKVRDICRDKMRSYELFPTLHPDTVLLRTQREVNDYLQTKNTTDIIVIKGLDSNEGKEVFIGPSGEYHNKITLPVIAQDFIETAAGYRGLVDGRHDVRVFLFDGNIIGGKLRTPLNGEYLSNIRFGGHNRALLFHELPKELVDITVKIDNTLRGMSSHRFIAADFGYDGTKWVLFEINPWPGLVDINDGSAEEQFMQQLAKHLAQCVDED